MAPELTLGLAWFKSTLAGNELWRFLAWLGGVLLAVLIGRIARYHLTQVAAVMERREKPVAAVFLRATARAIVFALVALAVDAGRHMLFLSARAEVFLATVMNVLVVVATTYVLYCLADAVCRAWEVTAKRTSSKMDDMLVPMVRRCLQITIVVLGTVQVATVLSDKPLTSILAGLGVGGLAVALAAQETIKNFFGSITVLTDKPFELGDRVVVDRFDGTVVEVGFRSTRLRTLDGDLVTIPNGELANKSILNSGRKPFYRRVINLGLAYDTPPVKVRRALAIIKEILAGHEGLDPQQPPRVFFTEFAGSSLTLMAVYWYNGSDGWDYLRLGETLNLRILDRFHEEGIGLAVQPSQTVYLAGLPGVNGRLPPGEGT